MKTKPIRILVADSKGATYDAIRSFLDGDPGYELLCRASNTNECLSLALLQHADLVIVADDLKAIPGIEVCEQLAVKHGGTGSVLVLRQAVNEDLGRRMLMGGVISYLIAPLDKVRTLEVIGAAVRENAARHRHRMDEHAHRMIAVTAPRAACGRTTVAVNLSCALARWVKPMNLNGSGVVLADLNVSGSDANMFLDLPAPLRSLADISVTGSDVDCEIVDSLLERHSTGINLLTSGTATPYNRVALSRHVVLSTLAVLRHRFMFTVIDMAESGTESGEIALNLSETILMVVGTDPLQMKAGRNHLQRLIGEGVRSEKIRVVLNSIREATDGFTWEQAEDILRFPVAACVPHEAELVPTSVNLGRPFVTTHPKEAISRVFATLAARLGDGSLTTKQVPCADKLSNRRGFAALGPLFGFNRSWGIRQNAMAQEAGCVTTVTA